MKKLIWTAAAAILLSGCGNALEREKEARREAENKAIVNNLRTVEYNGHSFIVYREIYGTKNFGGITHSPDCSCVKSKKRENHDTFQ